MFPVSIEYFIQCTTFDETEMNEYTKAYKKAKMYPFTKRILKMMYLKAMSRLRTIVINWYLNKQQTLLAVGPCNPCPPIGPWAPCGETRAHQTFFQR